ncbi:MAG: lipoyl(octanoyl) transferase LipB [Pseudomonadota bacterium]
MKVVDLGLISYQKAWQLQQELLQDRIANKIPDTLLLLEHPPVFTLGKRDCSEDIISTPEVIAADGIEIIQANRGGRITYHGPGQLVGYFIFKINQWGVKKFVWLLEEACLKTLAEYHIQGERDLEHPGIWFGKNKIAAIGLHVNNNVTQHGLAINVACNLNHYRHIIACGIKDRGQTSIHYLLGNAPKISEVKQKLIKWIEILTKS